MAVRERESFSIHHRTTEWERKEGKKWKRTIGAFSTVSLHPKQACSSPGSSSVLSCFTTHTYLQGYGVHSILPEAGPHNPRKAGPQALWAQGCKALPDLVPRSGLLVVVQHTELRGGVHTGCCLHMEPLVVGVPLLDSPVVMDILQPLISLIRGECFPHACNYQYS